MFLLIDSLIVDDQNPKNDDNLHLAVANTQPRFDSLWKISTCILLVYNFTFIFNNRKLCILKIISKYISYYLLSATVWFV